MAICAKFDGRAPVDDGGITQALVAMARANAIEECAQAAEHVTPRHTECGNKIAAAIRAIDSSPSRVLTRRELLVTPRVTDTELQRLREIEHRAWHVIEMAEEHASTGEVTIEPMREDYDKLLELLPEGHPVDVATASSGTVENRPYEIAND